MTTTTAHPEPGSVISIAKRISSFVSFAGNTGSGEHAVRQAKTKGRMERLAHFWCVACKSTINPSVETRLGHLSLRPEA